VRRPKFQKLEPVKLKNKNIVITGGSQGLGKEIVKHCLLEGASVAMCARDIKTLNEAHNELQQYKQQNQIIISRTADISNSEESKYFVGYCIEHFRSIDVLINNAGIHGSKNTIDDPEFDLENWIKAISINLMGTLNMCLAVVPYLKQNRHGKIINLSGGGATSPMPGMSAYASSKAAIVRFTETIALELKQYNIDVNAVAPGALNTRLLDDVLNNGNGKVTKEYYDKLLKQKETGGTPLRVGAELCVYLASDESDGITGKLISAVWDDWKNLHKHLKDLDSDIYTLRRIIPEDRGITFGYP
jgi:NAD(P)-dependent dehydrogenase (short-subunit alcohol dehydrogenase family)